MTVRMAAAPPTGVRRTAVYVLDVVRLIRVLSSLAGGITVVLGLRLAGGEIAANASPLTAVGGAIAAAVGLANVVNDIWDVRVDAVNKSDRPLPSGRVSVSAAGVIAVVLATTALVLAARVSAATATWMALLLAVAVGYSLLLKDTVVVGNVVVALCASTPVLFGAMVVDAFPAPVWVGAGLVFLFMLTNETLKTISDHQADGSSGLRTVATVQGVRASVTLLRVLTAVLTLGGLGAAAVSSTPGWYVAVALATYVLPSWTAVLMLGRAPAPTETIKSIYIMRFSWFFGLGALWLLA